MALAPVSPLAPLPLAELVAGRGLVHLERLPARPARYGELARPLPDRVWDALGVDRLWGHQAAAIDEVRAGRSVVLATGTASGKSLCYQAPIAEAALAPLRPGTALLHLPHQGPGPGPGPGPVRAGPARPGARHLRRRLLARGAHLGPGPRHRAAHQPGDAALRAAAPPRQVVHLPGSPRARRDRRAARPAGHLRHPRGPPAAPAPPGLQPLRVGPHLRLLLGHHRTAGPPGRRAVRPAGDRDHRRRLPEGRAPRRPVEPGSGGDRRPWT